MGILPLAQCWPTSLQIGVVGQSPLAEEVRAKASPAVRLLGQLARPELLKRMTRYNLHSAPSLYLEMQPTKVNEAMAVGLPVKAPSGNAGADCAAQFGARYVYSGSGELEESLQRVSVNRGAPGAAGRQAYLSLYIPECWLVARVAIYASAASTAENGRVV